MEKETISCLDLGSNTYANIPRGSLVFRPATYGMIIKDQHILLVPTRHGYALPGGAIEPGEHLGDALRREVYEETGLRVEVAQLLTATEDYYISAYDRKAYHSVMLIYSCADIQGEISTAQFSEYERKYYSEAQWVSVHDDKRITSAYPKLIHELLGKHLSQ